MNANDLTLKERITQPTPPFFKKVMAYGSGAIVLGAALIAAPDTLGLAIPILVKIGTIITTAGTAVLLIAKTAVDVEKAIKEGE